MENQLDASQARRTAALILPAGLQRVRRFACHFLPDIHHEELYEIRQLRLTLQTPVSDAEQLVQPCSNFLSQASQPSKGSRPALSMELTASPARQSHRPGSVNTGQPLRIAGQRDQCSPTQSRTGQAYACLHHISASSRQADQELISPPPPPSWQIRFDPGLGRCLFMRPPCHDHFMLPS